jgi:hypothetical protein
VGEKRDVPEPRTVNVRPSESDMIAGKLGCSIRRVYESMKVEGRKLGKF